MKNDFIEKILLLEKKVGHIMEYDIFEPYPINTSDQNEIDCAINELAKFIGLTSNNFFVNFTDLPKNIGGLIELDYWRENVEIKISTKIRYKNKKLWAVLAHEITHKFLYQKEIYFNDTIENEKFTDLTAVYLGFGKLMINSKKTDHRSIMGYLSQHELTFIYKTMNVINNVSRKNAIDGLSDIPIKIYDNFFSDFFNQIKYNEDEILKIVLDQKEKIINAQSFLQIIDNLNVLCKSRNKKFNKYKIDKKTTKIHLQLFNLQQLMKKVFLPEISKPTYNILILIILQIKNKDLNNELQNFKATLAFSYKKIKEIYKILINFNENINIIKKQLRCGKCNLIITYDNKNKLYTCRKCNYQFIIEINSANETYNRFLTSYFPKLKINGKILNIKDSLIRFIKRKKIL